MRCVYCDCETGDGYDEHLRCLETSMTNSSAAEQVIITFWLPANEKEQLEAIAALEERSVSALMRLLVRERIAKKEAA